MAVHFLQLGQGRSRGDARRRSTTAANSKIAVGLPWPTVSRLTPHAVLRPEASLLLRFQRLSVASVRRVFSTRSLLGFYRVLPCFFFILNSVLLSFTGFSRIAMWFVSIFRRLIGFKFIFSTLTGMTFKMVEKKWLAFCSVPIGNNGWGDIVEINVLFRVKRPNTFTKKKTPAPTLMASHRQPPYLLCELVARFIEIKGET